MEIHQLRYFVAVAEEMHFGRAAERLLVTPSPLSKQIRRLERELGGDLFVRDHHAVRLTPLGSQILEPVRDILVRVDALKAIRVSRSEQLRLGATPLAPTAFLSDVQTILAELTDGAHVEITLAPTTQLLPLLEGRKLDFALVYRPLPEGRFETFDVGSHDYLVGMKKDDPLAEREFLTLADLADGTLVTPVHNFHPEHQRNVRDRFRESGINNLVEVAHGNTSVVAAHVRMLGARTLVPAVDGHPTTVALQDDAFALVPLQDESMHNVVAFAALGDALRERPDLWKVFEALRSRFDDESSDDIAVPTTS